MKAKEETVNKKDLSQTKTKKDIVKMLLKNKDLEDRDEAELIEMLIDSPIAIDVDRLASEKETWKDIFERIIQTSKINSDQGYSVFHKVDYIFKASKENGELKIINKIDENKKLEDLIKENKIDVKKLFEITPEEDKNNSVKIRLKRPQDYDE